MSPRPSSKSAIVAPSPSSQTAATTGLDAEDVVTAQGWKRWLVWTTVSVGYGFAFFQRVAPSGVVDGLREDLGVRNTDLGTLGAEYYYLYIVNQIPIGLAISKFGVRKTLLVCSIVATIGSLAFALAPQLWMIHVGRLLVGWGVSSVFLSFVAVAKEYFHPSSASTAMGCTMAVGIAGGILAQGPLAAVSGLLGWRLVMALSSIVPAGVAVMAGLFMPNFGPYHHRSQPAGTGAASMPLCQQWSHMWRMVQLWVVAATGFCMNIAPMSFLGLWAVPFFKHRYGITAGEAGLIASAGFVGTLIGSPLMGTIADRFSHARKAVLLVSNASQTVCLVLLVFVHVPIVLAAILCFVVGMANPINVLLAHFRAFLRSRALEHITPFAAGVGNTFFLASPILVQPLVGAILESRAGAATPSQSDYRAALVVFPVGAFIALVLAAFLRDTPARARPQPAEPRRLKSSELVVMPLSTTVPVQPQVDKDDQDNNDEGTTATSAAAT